VLRELYALTHTKAPLHSKLVIMQHKMPAKSVFPLVKQLKSMPADEAGGVIIQHRIPLLTAWGLAVPLADLG
jgi:hypothetical protein